MSSWLDQATVNQSSLTRRSWNASSLSDLDQLSTEKLNALIEQGDLLKHDGTTSVVRLDLAGQDIIIKRYNARSQWHRLSRSVRQSRASRCWQMSYAFQRAGLSVARPLLMLERRFGPLRRTAYFVSESLDGVELLSKLSSFQESEKISVVAAMNNAFSLMRQNGLSHGDLKASNLIWQNERIYFIDLDAARQHNCERSWINANRKDRRRFLKNWQADEQLLSLFEGLD